MVVHYWGSLHIGLDLNSMKAPVSVVIPTYNAAATVAETLLSVCAQTRMPREVIVVDDCSSDNTIEVVKSVAQNFESGQLKIVQNDKNQGAAETRNTGWSLASGEYVAFLDADDTWHPRKIELQYEYLKNNRDLLLCGHTFSLKGAQETKERIFDVSSSKELSTLRIIFSNPFVTPSVMIRRDLPLRFKSTKRHMEDHLLWMQVALSGYKVSRLNIPLAILGKVQFGESGLSADLVAMELAELENYKYLWTAKKISGFLFFFLIFYSLLKFIRRLSIVGYRRVRRFFFKSLIRR
jgi:glycosyltransferase involved in cell wall biosynthesis